MAFKFVRTNRQSVDRASEAIKNGETIDVIEMIGNEHVDGAIEGVDNNDNAIEDVDDLIRSIKP